MYLQSIKLQSESPHCWADRCQSFKLLSNITLCIYLINRKWHFLTIPLRGSIKIIFSPVNSTQIKTSVGLALGALFRWVPGSCIFFSLPNEFSNCSMLDMGSKVTDIILIGKFKIEYFLLLSLNLEAESIFKNLFSLLLNHEEVQFSFSPPTFPHNLRQ